MTAAKKRAKQLDMAFTGVVLAVDTARISGWAIRAGHALRYSGELDTLDPHSLDAAVSKAKVVAIGALSTRPPVLVLERAWGGQVSTIVALGQARERWLGAWQRAGLSRSRVVSVYPQQWRPAILGRGIQGIGREELRARELLSAQAECRAGLQLGPDEAAAILISRWAVRSPKVAAKHGGQKR
jgi:hypothetical protein